MRKFITFSSGKKNW